MDQALVLNNEAIMREQERRRMELEQQRQIEVRTLYSKRAKIEEESSRVMEKLGQTVHAGTISAMVAPLIFSALIDFGYDPFMNWLLGAFTGLWVSFTAAINAIPIVGQLISIASVAMVPKVLIAWLTLQWVVGMLISGALNVYLNITGRITRFKAKVTYVIICIIIGNIPLVSLFPDKVIFFIISQITVMRRASKAKKKLENFKNLTNEEILALDDDIAALDNA